MQIAQASRVSPRKTAPKWHILESWS
jgi:hypothetical protein